MRPRILLCSARARRVGTAGNRPGATIPRHREHHREGLVAVEPPASIGPLPQTWLWRSGLSPIPLAHRGVRHCRSACARGSGLPFDITGFSQALSERRQKLRVRIGRAAAPCRQEKPRSYCASDCHSRRACDCVRSSRSRSSCSCPRTNWLRKQSAARRSRTHTAIALCSTLCGRARSPSSGQISDLLDQ